MRNKIKGTKGELLIKRCVTIFLAILLLPACGTNEQIPAWEPESSPPSVSEPASAPEPSSAESGPEESSSAAESESTSTAESIPITESEDTEPEENIDYSKMKQFITPLTDADGADIGVLSFAIQFPEGWTVSDNRVYDTEKRQIAEILPSIVFGDESIFDKLAKQYPDSDPISVTVAGFSGKCFIHQTPSDDPAFAESLNNEVFYYLKVEDWLICIRFIPAPGVGIGTQREAFEANIKAII